MAMILIMPLGLPFMIWHMDDFDMPIQSLLMISGRAIGLLIVTFGIIWLISNRYRKQLQQSTITLTETAIERYDGQQNKRFVYQDIERLIVHYNYPDTVGLIKLFTPNDFMSFWELESMSDLLQILQTRLADTVKVEEHYEWAPKWYFLIAIIPIIIMIIAYNSGDFVYYIVLILILMLSGIYSIYHLKQPGIASKQRIMLILLTLFITLSIAINMYRTYLLKTIIHPCDAIGRHIQKSGCVKQFSGGYYINFLPDNETIIRRIFEQIKIQPLHGFGWNATRLHHNYHAKAVYSSIDGTVIATGSWGDTISVWDVPSQTIIWQKNYPPYYENKIEAIESFTLSPNGKLLALGRWHEVVLWDIATDKPALTLPVSRSMAFSPNGLQIAIKGQEGNSVDIWQIETGQKINTLGQWKGGDLSHLAYSLDGRFLVAKGYPNIFVWRLDTGEIEQTWLNRDLDYSSPPAISADGRWVASGYQTGQEVNRQTYIKIWQVADGTVLKTIWLTEYPNILKHLSFSPDSRLLGIAILDEVLIYDMAVLLGEELYEK